MAPFPIRDNRLPNVKAIHTRADDGGSARGRVKCPHCKVAMVWDGLKINNFFCPLCGYEWGEQQQQQQQQTPLPSQQPTEEELQTEQDTFAEGYLATIDGYIDVGPHAKTNDTARFRPVEAPRGVRRNSQPKWTSPSAQELEMQGLKVTDSKEIIFDDGTFIDIRSNHYDPRVRRRRV